MKKLFYLIVLIGMSTVAQNKYLTKTGAIHFEASVPWFEEVSAQNNSVTAILNTETGEFAALVLVKGFRFKNALMEEHFNENYAESYRYPKATFKGKIRDFSINQLANEAFKFSIDGDLSFHGQTKKLEAIDLEVFTIDDSIIIKGTFKASASDYDIKIPKVVSNKISKDIEVSFEFKLKKK